MKMLIQQAFVKEKETMNRKMVRLNPMDVSPGSVSSVKSGKEAVMEAAFDHSSVVYRRKRPSVFVWLRPWLYLCLFAAGFTLISFLFINVGDLRHDYGFHLARITGLAQSISHGDWLPSLTYVFEGGIGYASPMFYGNWQFYLPALFYLAVRNAPMTYAFFVFLLSTATACSGFWAVKKMGGTSQKAACFGVVCILGYPWFGYGMTMVIPFVPVLFYAMYKVLYQNENSPVLLAVVIALLIQTHILSTLVLAMMSAVFVGLNLKRLTWKKAGSFGLSAGLGLLLSVGYLFQYFEQTASQTFFFSWGLRDYPFAVDQVTRGFSLTELFSEPLRWIPCGCWVLLACRWNRLNSLVRQLLIVSGIFLLLPSTLIPWDHALRYTFLAVLQDTRRLAYFCPLLIYLACALGWSDRRCWILTGVLSLFYIMFCLVPCLPSQKILEILDSYDRRAAMAVEMPWEDSFDASGDEYFTIGIVHADKKRGILSEFQNPDEVLISNVHKDYNLLEFDFTLPDDQRGAGLILPEIYYKGYQAEYSNGGEGSQPQMLMRPLSSEEIARNEEEYKPAMTQIAEYNGKIYLQLNRSGHVRIFYEKTPIQLAGFRLEVAGWIFLGLWLIGNELKKVRGGLVGNPYSLWSAQRPSEIQEQTSAGNLATVKVTVQKELNIPPFSFPARLHRDVDHGEKSGKMNTDSTEVSTASKDGTPGSQLLPPSDSQKKRAVEADNVVNASREGLVQTETAEK